MLEFENLTAFGDQNYNDTLNGKVQFPVIADPETTEVNQAILRWSGLPDTVFALGRHRIIYENHRFMGNVGFRQNEQTFDAARLVNKSISNVTFNYDYLWGVQRIFGDDSRVGDFNTNSHAINLSYDGFDFGRFVGYGYLLDIDDNATLSSKTFGLRFKGKSAIGEDLALLYTAEYAFQSEHAQHPRDFGLHYVFFEPGISFKSFVAKFGYEILSGNGVDGFQTPLATLHAHQGWADVILATPGDGIEDIYGILSYTARGFGAIDGLKLTAIYHDFNESESNDGLGTEWDFEISKSFLKDHLKLAVTYATYDADTFAVDTDKFWVTVQLKY